MIGPEEKRYTERMKKKMSKTLSTGYTVFDEFQCLSREEKFKTLNAFEDAVVECRRSSVEEQ